MHAHASRSCMTRTLCSHCNALQVYDAVLSAATPGTVALSLQGTGGHGFTASTPHGRLLNSNLYKSNLDNPRSSESVSGTLDAALYALKMEFSAGSLRNEVGEALIGVHFPHLAPSNLTDHIHVELDDGTVLGPEAMNMMHVPGNAQGQIVSVTMPVGFSGEVRYFTRSYTTLRLAAKQPCGSSCHLYSLLPSRTVHTTATVQKDKDSCLKKLPRRVSGHSVPDVLGFLVRRPIDKSKHLSICGFVPIMHVRLMRQTSAMRNAACMYVCSVRRWKRLRSLG
jgi:hypothetical protein